MPFRRKGVKRSAQLNSWRKNTQNESFAFKTSVIPKATGGSVLKWSIIYEKLNEADASDPYLYMDFCKGMSAAFDSHFRNTN
ncbi:hypothetical protein Syun_016587 [Stephania yunnanensis]|uniref:Bet v I/Major latex protein domain-containing protein n=1 Tax=Stephania yunnanensis TaxID=152371 RepID=A0AAP0J6B4_9MAGN